MRTSLVFALALGACVPFALTPAGQQQAYRDATVDANSMVDAQMVPRVETARANVKANPGSAREAAIFIRELQGAVQTGTIGRKFQGATLEAEALAALDAASAANPAEAPTLDALAGTYLFAVNQPERAEAKLRASLAKRQSLGALLPLLAHLDRSGRTAEVVPLCKAARPAMETDDHRYELLFASILHGHAASPEGGLAWTTPADLAFYKAQKQLREAQAQKENAEWRKAQDAKREKLYADMEKSRQESAARDRCRGNCNAQLHTCQAHCFGDLQCRTSCEQANNSCHGTCR